VSIQRVQITIRGTVQGVGFRPHVYRCAQTHGILGWVINNTEGVVIDAEGDPDRLRRFVDDVRTTAPPLAIIDEVEVAPLPVVGYTEFAIRSSEARDGLAVPVSADVGTCDDCLRELLDPADRRYQYPFTNCTNCGPRFTIVEDVPYDRPRTTMRVFQMCPDCQREYDDPADRRFHAQPNACPVCGPSVSLLDRDGKVLLAGRSGGAGASPDIAVIRRAAEMLAEGKVLAIRGIGGFHLACDATNPIAVATLRERKRRVDKPFAILALDVASAAQWCEVSESERALLESPARPIVLLRRRSDIASPIADAVAPGNRSLGVMLPYTPLHHLLMREFRRVVPHPAFGTPLPPSGRGVGGEGQPAPPFHVVERGPGGEVALVLTSGNVSEEPIARDNAEAVERLGDLADAFLVHNREIHIRCDDSVARVFRGRPTLIRRSRGFAPSPVRLRRNLGQILACGAELKNTFCLTRDNYAFISQHIGDLENYETYESYTTAIEHFERLFRVEPGMIAYDLHPEYLSTRYALERVEASAGRLIGVAVQHHEAHFASCMVEHGLEGLAIGVAFDGTGYGHDGAVWGGEVFVGGYEGMARAAHLGYVRLPGGDLAVRRPARMALSHLLAAYGPDRLPALSVIAGMSADEASAVRGQVASGLNSLLTSSVGRLFDAVAAILDVRDEVNYEGQAAIELEALADERDESCYEWPLTPGADGCLIADPAEVIRHVVADALAGRERRSIAARFHNSVARLVVSVCETLRARDGLDRVCLSGGVFQNALLLGRTIDWLEAAGFEVFTQRLVPPNDGGICLGQAAIAAARATC
jgi:hydrogenase maturation protein HypF